MPLPLPRPKTTALSPPVPLRQSLTKTSPNLSPFPIVHFPKPIKPSPFLRFSLNPPSLFPLSSTNPSAAARSGQLPFPSSPLLQIRSFLLSEWQLVLKGWLCSAVSVYCLSNSVPKIGRLPSVLAGASTPGRMVEMGLPLMVLALVNCAANYLQQAFLWEAALNTVCKLRVHVFGRVLYRDLGFFEGSGGVPAGDVAYRITAEASDVADTLYALLNMIVPNTLQLVAMATQMVAASPVLSLASVLVIPCLCLAIASLGESLRQMSQKAHASVARLSSYLNEVLPSMLIVKANNAEAKESSWFQNLVEDDLRNLLRKRKMKALILQITQILCIGGLFMLCIASIIVLGGSFDCSSLVSFITSLALLAEPIKGMGKAYNELRQGEPAVERLFDLTRYNSQVTDKPGASELETVEGDIRFCNVTFRYGDNMPVVLNGLNLHIKPGETVALVGPSGGGKTTLTKLLLHLYNPSSGCILLDDHDIQNTQVKSLRKHISLVSQDIVLFTGTVAENIAYKDPPGKINMERVENAAKIANADEFISKLPDGYETNVGPKGSRLSGGQRQRLAIARAVYQDSSILILDEATSALDSSSELLVRQSLGRLMADHTVLCIAHRLETVLMADRILLLEDGRLEEVTRSAFLARDGRCGSLLSSELIAR